MFPPSAKILIVDDSAIYREVVKLQLKELGYSQFLEADDGLTALNVLIDGTQGPIDLVICDWHMKQMSGMQLLLKVRALEQFKKLPFLLITTEGQMEKVLDAIMAGVSDYIVKPVTKEMLQKKMAVAYSKSGKN